MPAELTAPAELTVPAQPTAATEPTVITAVGPVHPDQPAGLSPAPLLPLVPFFRPPAVARPLPDAVAVRVIPDTCPPYDDEPGRQDWEVPLTAGAPAPVPGETAPRATAPAGAAGGAGAGPAAVPPGWPRHFAQVLAETLAGSRPAQQIVPWTTEQAQRHIQRLGPLITAGSQPRVRRVVAFRPSADVLEMTVVLGVGTRVRALAVRMERTTLGMDRARSAGRPEQRGRPGLAATGHRGTPVTWVCTAVEAA